MIIRILMSGPKVYITHRFHCMPLMHSSLIKWLVIVIARVVHLVDNDVVPYSGLISRGENFEVFGDFALSSKF